MGAFYTNYTLRGPSQIQVAEALVGRKAIVSPEINGCIVAFDEASDSQDQDLIRELAAALSASLQCPVLAALNHDDDILWYVLCVKGALHDEYNSAPDYFDPSTEQSQPEGGDAHHLCEAFGAGTVSEITSILRASSFEKPYVFAQERHAALVRALNLPEIAVGNCYASFAGADMVDGLAIADFLHTTEPEGNLQTQKPVWRLDTSLARDISLSDLENETRHLPRLMLLGREGDFIYIWSPDRILYRLPAHVTPFAELFLPVSKGTMLYITVRNGKITIPEPESPGRDETAWDTFPPRLI